MTNWQHFWDHKAKPTEDPQTQVARTIQGKAADAETLARISTYISQQLDLQAQDRLLDVCCGNGALTQVLAQQVDETVGVDFSVPHLEVARQQFGGEQLSYLRGDARQLSTLSLAPFDKICLYFSFQYFDTYRDGAQVVQEMARLLKPSGRILIGDVPDWDRLSVFYPKTYDRFRYHLARWRGRDQMGRFWKKSQLMRMADEAGLSCQPVLQPDFLPYAHYRVDYVLGRR
ncbi:MAG: class I SAM-dependent methyltransferase [Bacteroidota bacterium]